MPESEINTIDTAHKFGFKPDDQTFNSRQEEHETEKRINVLFGKDKTDGSLKEQEEEDYQTVNEDMTTDTADSGDFVQRGIEKNEEKGEDSLAPAEEGILSSDDEVAVGSHHTEKLQKQNKIKDKPITDQEKVLAFDGKKMYVNERAREEAENQFNFGDADVEFFSAKIETSSEKES